MVKKFRSLWVILWTLSALFRSMGLMHFDTMLQESSIHLKTAITLRKGSRRITQMMIANQVSVEISEEKVENQIYINAMENFDIKAACDEIWKIIQKTDQRIQEIQPFRLVKTDLQKGKEEIAYLGRELNKVAVLLSPIMPHTSRKIKEAIAENKKTDTLFPRKE